MLYGMFMYDLHKVHKLQIKYLLLKMTWLRHITLRSSWVRESDLFYSIFYLREKSLINFYYFRMKVKYLDSRWKFEDYFTDEIISMYKPPY